MRRMLLATLLLWPACGGDDDLTPPELREDPAITSGCLPDAVGTGVSRAKAVDCVAELPAGRLVSGRVGDIMLENSRLRIIIRGFGAGYYFMGTKAGGIVDAARHGSVDLIKEVIPLFNFNGGGFTEFVITEAGDDGPATVVVRGPIEAVPFVAAAIATVPTSAIAEQHYILAPDSDEVLFRTFLYPNGAEGNITVGDAFFYGGLVRSWMPRHGELEGTANVELVASTGSSSSYGLVYPADALAAISFVDIASVKIGLGPSRTLSNPAPIERWFIIGDGSASSVTDRAWALRGVATGTLQGSTAPGVDVMVESDGSPMTIGRADTNGNYSIDLPAGSYTAWSRDDGRVDGVAATATITAGAPTTLDLAAGASGTLALTVVDDAGHAVPARVSLRQALALTTPGLEPAPQPLSSSERRIEYAGADGTLELALPPGDYTLDVSRGMEYDAYTVDPLTISDGETTTVAATVNRVIDTSGWIAVDTHIHSEMSTDSQIPLDVRLLAVAAEGVEVAISTDHDFVTDYAPVIEELGLSAFVTSQPGVETSSLVWGHVNSWPLVPDYDQPAGDAIPWFGRSPADVFALMRARGAGTVIQINHPRASDSGLFEIVDFSPETLTALRDPTDLDLPDDTDLSAFDVDAIEVCNSFDSEGFAASLTDWLALVAGGHPAAITGSSDSHGRSSYIGHSRTYVYVGAGNDDPAVVDLDELNQALKARKAVVAQGAFVTAAIIDPGTSQPGQPGELIDLTGESVAPLRIMVQAPPWMPLAKIVVYHGRDIAATIALDSASTDAIRYDDVVELAPGDGDGFFVIHVVPAGPGSPVLGQPDGSVTNPLLYDRDGDGDWNP